jgi:thiamine biosynthesis protein ThiS
VKIQVTVNGQPRSIPAGQSLDELLRALELDARMVVVEHNRNIVRRPDLSDTTLGEGDQVELVHFVGGG